ncbi:MAG: hypothetical protein E4G99_02730 [Anaerolineales bacterium]|nr:MAG: hypothetical protein E4G99_02730 [Anaerolineales bacterium]
MEFLNNLGINSPLGFIGLGLFVIGGFMILAGFDIISIEKVTVKQGRRTWVVGIIFATLGILLFIPEISSKPELANSVVATESMPIPAEISPNEPINTLTGWNPINFLITNNSLWRDTGEGIYTAMGSEDAFAWSRETYDGNLMLSLDLESSESKSSGCVVIYGDGNGFSQGNLIFCVDWDGYGLEKHTIYHDGENRLTFTHSNVDLKDNVYSLTIEIMDDVASMYVNGERVFSSLFDAKEINHSGRVGLLKKWFDPQITFSNIKIKMVGDEN